MYLHVNKTMKNILAAILAFLLLSSITTASFISYAGSNDNNISFSFLIKEKMQETHESSSRYRGTTNNKNAWKVNLRSSGEGNGTKTKFAIGLKDGTKASEWYTVKQGSGAHYFAANDAGDKADVYLYGKNNNYTFSDYTVKGYWDEETGISPD